MAALTADRLVPSTASIDSQQGSFTADYLVEAAETIFKGAFVQLGTNGIQAATTGVGAEPCLGIALEQGAAAERVQVQVGAILVHAVGSVAVANIGDAVYASDDQTLTLVSTNGVLVGNVINVITAGTATIKMNYPGQA